jgi:hypothetical protein
MNEKLAAARAPQAIVQDVAACTRAAAPSALARLTADPWWGVTTVAAVWMGTTPPEQVLIDVAPECRTALAAARPYLEGKEA